MNGIKEQKAGNQSVPPIWSTFLHSLKLIFFKEHPFIVILLDKRITFNLISIFFIMFLIPVKDITTNKVVLEPSRIIESLLITFFYILILYFFVLHRKINFIAFLRLFMAIEVVDIFNIITLFLSGDFLKITMLIILSWYLSLSIIILSRLGSFSYLKASFIVIATFLFVNLIPAIL